MMVGSIVNINVTVLNYKSAKYILWETKGPSIVSKGFCFLTTDELVAHKRYKRHRKGDLIASFYRYYKWYNSILQYELSFTRENSRLRVNQCEMQSGNFRAFCINGEFYPTVTLVLSSEMEYWYYSVPGNDMLYLCGSKVLNKSKDIFHEELDALERKQRRLRPQPSDELLRDVIQGYADEPSVVTLAKPPYFTCKFEESLDCLDDVCKCNNLSKFETMLQHTMNVNRYELLSLHIAAKAKIKHDTDEGSNPDEVCKMQVV